MGYWYQDSVNSSFSHTGGYAYDSLNRVSTAKSQATSGSDCWGQSFGYDRYANLTTISSTQCSAPILSLSVNTNNRITNSGFSYDAAGDLTGDGVNTYAWNAEAHLNSAASVTYTYDGDLRRVKKSNGTLYWYCAACGKVLAESDLSGNLTSEYTFFGEQAVWRFYCDRGFQELPPREFQDAYAMSKIPTRRFSANAPYLEAILWAYDLVLAFQRLCLPPEVHHWNISTLRRELWWLPAEGVRRGHRNVLALPARYPRQDLFAKVQRATTRVRPLI